MTDVKRLSNLLRLIAHPARLEILNLMRGSEICVCQMEARLGYRQAYISQHLMALREAGLVADRRQGWQVFYRALQPGLFALLDAAAALDAAPAMAESGLNVHENPTPARTARRRAPARPRRSALTPAAQDRSR